MARGVPLFFDAQWYLKVHADVAQAGMDPLRHYLRHGQREGRAICPSRAQTQERDLRWRMLGGGVAALHQLTTDPEATPPEQVWAHIACARAAARDEDWATAARHLWTLNPETELIRGYAQIDPALLAVEAAIVTGDPEKALQIWQLARRWLPGHPDLWLARANIHPDRDNWRGALRRIYWRRGLRTPDVTAGRWGFDALTAPPVPPGTRGPLVSVVMPAHNAGTTIDTALRSLMAQSHGHLEVIVVDNGSTDDTVEVATRLAKSDPRLRVVSAPDAPGAYAARNHGMAAAQGEFVTVLDADDWAHPQRIARQVAALQRRPQAMAAQTDWVRVTPDLRFTRWHQDQGHIHPDTSSLMIRAKARAALGDWDRVRASADTEYRDRLLAHYGAQAVERVLPGVPMGFGRKHAASLTATEATSIHSHTHGARRSYLMAARRWHAQAPVPPLPLPGLARPFPAPAELAVGDPPAAPGEADRLMSSGNYEDTWVLQTYPDLRARDVDGLTHYMTTGAAEARDPGPRFSTSGYALWRDVPLAEVWRHALDDPDPKAWLPTWQGEAPRQPEQPHVVLFGHRAQAALFGAERGLLHVADQARACGFSVTVVLPQIATRDFLDAVRQRCHAVHIRPYGWHFAGVPPHPATLALLTDLLRHEAPDQVHQMTCVLDAPLLAAQALDLPTTLHLREQPALDPWLCQDLGTTAPALRAHLLRHADRICSVSQEGLNWLNAGARALRWHNRALPALADLPFAPADPPRIALIGSLTRRKGLHDMVALARDATASGLPARFLLIGPESEELRALGPLPPGLTHAGYAPDPVAALSQADIVLNLSHMAESHGMTVHEALLAGRPVVTYARGALPELIGDSAGGILTPPDDPAAVLQALRQILAGDMQARSAAARTRGLWLQSRADTGNRAAFLPAGGD